MTASFPTRESQFFGGLLIGWENELPTIQCASHYFRRPEVA